MQAFVSLIVWLFSVTGADGLLVVRPSHLVLVNGSTATIKCSSNKSFPTWKQDDWFRDDKTDVVDENCIIRDRLSYSVKKIQEPSRFTCDLTIKPTAPVYHSGGHTARHTCADITDNVGTDYSYAQAILLYLAYPLKCKVKANELSCKLRHSAYKNTTAMLQYLKILLVLEDSYGNVVATKSAGFWDNKTVLTAEVNNREASPPADPYVCSVSFEVHCDRGFMERCVADLTIVSPEAVECRFRDYQPQYDDYDDQQQEEVLKKEGAIEFPAKIRIPFLNQTSNAKLERDNVDAIALLLSLVAAFLVH